MSVQNTTGIQVYDQMVQWRDAHEENLNDALEKLSNGENEDSVFAEYEKKENKLGKTFDFMEGKDFNNEADYQAQLLKLGQGEVKQKDLDGDGKVSFNEYVLDEIKGAADDEIKGATMFAGYLFQIIDYFMGNDDGSIDENEFATFYQYLEQYQGDGTSVRDGKIDIDLASEYPMYLVNQRLEQN